MAAHLRFDRSGYLIGSSTVDPHVIDKMSYPVRCTHCGEVYDASTVTVTARYADCSMWISPCCHRNVDDRTWKSSPDIEKL